MPYSWSALDKNFRSVDFVLGFPVGSTVENLPANAETQEMQVQALGQEDPLE